MSNLPLLGEPDHMEPTIQENVENTIQSTGPVEPISLNERINATLPHQRFGRAYLGGDAVSPDHFAPKVEQPKLEVLNVPSNTESTGKAFILPISGNNIKGKENDASAWNNVAQALAA